MNQEQFTPGPWQITGFVNTISINNKDIAFVHYHGNERELFANTKLIKMAPTMYSTLKDLYRITQTAFSEYPPVNRAFAEWGNRAKAVLNEATL